MRKEYDGGRRERTGLKVVLDTNVYVSIFSHPEKPIFQVWLHAVKYDYQLLTSPTIIREFSRISRKRFGWDEKKVHLHVRFLNKVGNIVVPKTIPDIIKEDPDRRKGDPHCLRRPRPSETENI